MHLIVNLLLLFMLHFAPLVGSSVEPPTLHSISDILLHQPKLFSNNTDSHCCETVDNIINLCSSFKQSGNETIMEFIDESDDHIAPLKDEILRHSKSNYSVHNHILYVVYLYAEKNVEHELGPRRKDAQHAFVIEQKCDKFKIYQSWDETFTLFEWLSNQQSVLPMLGMDTEMSVGLRFVCDKWNEIRHKYGGGAVDKWIQYNEMQTFVANLQEKLVVGSERMKLEDEIISMINDTDMVRRKVKERLCMDIIKSNYNECIFMVFSREKKMSMDEFAKKIIDASSGPKFGSNQQLFDLARINLREVSLFGNTFGLLVGRWPTKQIRFTKYVLHVHKN